MLTCANACMHITTIKRHGDSCMRAQHYTCTYTHLHPHMHTCIRMKFVFPGSPTQGHHSIQAHLRLTGQFLISLKGHRMLCAQRLHPQKLLGPVQEQEKLQLTRQRLLYGIGLERGLKHQGRQRQRRAGLCRMFGIGLERVHNYHGQGKEQCTAL